jgi:hypothetical protein
MTKRYQGGGWVARLDETLGFDDVGLRVNRDGGREAVFALKCSVMDDARSSGDRASGKAYLLSDGSTTVGRWYKDSNTLVLDLGAFAAAKRDRGHGGLSSHEFSGEVTLELA